METALKEKHFASALKNAVVKFAPSVIFGAVIMKIIISEYLLDNNYLLYFSFAVYECVLFFLFEKIKSKKTIRGFIYIALMSAVIGVCYFALSGDWFLSLGGEDALSVSRVNFSDWFYLNVTDVGLVPSYVAVLYIGLVFFLVSIIYYFTIIRYRTFGMLLVILFPFVIYGRRAQTISQFDITLMITLFLVLIVHSKLVADDMKENKAVINFSYAITVALFVTFVGALTMFVPKPEIESKLEQNNDFFSMFKTNVQRTEYDDLNDVSSPRFGADVTGEILFYLNTTSPQDVIYLRRQNFDVFENNQWVNNSAYYQYDDENDENYSYYMMDKIRNYYDIMKMLAATGKYEKYGLTYDLFEDDIYSKDALMNIYSSTFAPSYLPVPLMVNSDSINEEYSINNHGDVVFSGNSGKKLLNSTFHYTVEGQPERDYAESLPFDWSKFLQLLSDAYQNGDIDKDTYLNLLKVYTLYINVYDYSDRMKSLAEQITQNCKNDYEKAQAFVNYFESSGFAYDLDYEPEDESIDYFLFESRTGTCTSYATAMTLMARIVGLPARYVEGFATNEVENGRYVVRDSCAHAFVEVYISGLGWMTFDPTVPGYMDIRQRQVNTDQTGVSETVKMFMYYFSRLILFLAVVFVVIFIVLIDRIIEVFFRFSLKFKKYPDRVLKLYRRTLRLLEISTGEHLKGLTPQRLERYAQVRKGADICLIVSIFERVCFGGYVPTKEEYEQIYKSYKANWKLLIKKEKRKNKSPSKT